MVKLRKSYLKLKIALCCVLGVIVGLGGVLAIWVLSSALQGEKEIIRPDNTVSYRKPLPDGATYSQLRSDGIDTLGYLAYVLDCQQFYHSESNTQSTANIFPVPQYTDSYKDYKDGIMLSSDFTYGIISEGTQSCFVPEGNAEGEGAGVYMRTSAGNVDQSTTGTTCEWEDDVTYYDRQKYLYTYGEYSTEMTVYILNEETVISWDEVRDNGDGTYSQKFYLDAEKAAYYYQNAMKTRGGLDRLPVFESISLDFTFDDNYRVLSIQAVENSQITRYSMSMSSVSLTSTTYAYDEASFDQPHRDLYEDYYEQFVGELDSSGDDDEELDPLTLLMNAFAGVINGEGQQFEATLAMGGTTYYGRIYLSVDMNGISTGDILGAIEARIAVSADENIDSQDLYIQLENGIVEGYYSADFALTADASAFGDIIKNFQAWVDSLGSGGAAVINEGEGEEGGSSLDDILNQLINGIKTEETDTGLVMTLSLDDLAGIGLSAEFTFDKTVLSDGTAQYSLNVAEIGGISFNGDQIALSLALKPSEAEIISHDKSEAPFDVAKGAESLYQLLSSEAIKVELTLQGDKLADLLLSLGADLDSSLDELKLEVYGGVDVNGLTVDAGVRLINYVSGAELLNADVWYEYNGNSGEYGTAYLNITNILGIKSDVKVYCDISELYSTVTELVNQISGQAGISVYAADGGLDIAGLINGILGLDFGSVIKEITANSTVIGATVNADEIFSLLGVNLSLGDITLRYSLGDFERDDYNAVGGWLFGSVPAIGAEAYIYGSTAALTQPQKDEYLNLTEVLNAALNILNGEEVGVDITLTGAALADVLVNAGVADLGTSVDNLVLAINGDVNVKALTASASVKLTDGEKVLLDASVYYDYSAGANGTAYIKVTNVLGAACEVKVYGEIDKTVENVKALITAIQGAIPETLAEDGDSSTNVADIVAKILAIDFGGIVTDLKVNASGLTTTINADNLISQFADINLGIGEVTLSYADGKLTGSALSGGLEITASKGEVIADTEGYLDINEVLNAALNILDGEEVGVDITLTGAALADVLVNAGVADLGSSVDNLVLTISGDVNVKALTASASVKLTDGEKVLLDAIVYYDYNAGANGTAYIKVTNVLGAACEVKVYGEIDKTVENVKALITAIQGAIPETLAEDSANTTNVADIVAKILAIDFGGIVTDLKVNASGLTTTINADNLISQFADINLGIGEVTLSYADGKLTGSALSGGLEITASKGEVIADTEGYLDINEVLNTALNILNGEEVGVDITLTGSALADVLVNAGVADLGASVDNLVLAINGDVNVKALTASASVKLTDGEKVLLDAIVYYDYNAGANGTAYMKVTNVLGAACEVKVYGEIDKTVENVKALITAIQGAIPETLAEEGDSTTNVADIVAKILAIDFGGIVTDLKVNASGLTTTINADNLISQFADINLGIGEVTLSYADGKLTGSALSGGLEITASKGEVVKDTEGYLDINEVLNAALNILDGEEVGVDITLTGAALADVLTAAGVADLGTSVDNLVLTINGDVNVKALTASASVKITDENNYSYLDADIYYEYAAGTYGKVYVALNALLGKDLNGSVKVYCDINSAAEQITQLISVINGTDGASSLDVNQPSDEENTVQAIIKTVLGLDFCDMVKELAMNAEGFKATVDLGRILSLAGVDLELGEVTLLYDFASDMLTGSALNGGLELKAYSGKAISVPEGDYLDVAELLNSVNMLLSDNVGVNITLTGEALEKFLKNNNLVDLNGLLDGATLSISGSADISTLKARAQVELYEQGGEEEYYYLDAEIYYDYSQGEYGTAYINIRQLFGEKCDIKVKSNIADTVTSVENLIAAINAASVKAASETEADPALDSVTEIISSVLAMRLDLVILSMQSGVDGFTVELDADALVGEILKLVNSGASVPVTFGNVTLAYSIENNTLSGSALDGGLQITVNKGGEIGEAPLGYTDIVTVIELITKATDIADSIAEKRAVAFDIDAIITANGVSFRLFGKGEIMWNEAGVVTVVALDVQLSLYSGAADETPMDLEFIYNGTAAGDEPFIRLAINNSVLNITRGDIKSTEEQINTIVAAVNKIFGNGSTDVKALEELAEEAGMTTVSGVPSTSGTSVTVVDSQLIKALVGALGGEGLAGELFTTLLSGSSVTVDELGNYINVLFKDGADITLGVDGGKLTLCGEVKADGLFAADIKASASAEVKDLAGTLAEAFDAEGGKYVQYSVSEGNPLIKIVYYYILDSFDGLDIGSFLGGKSYKVDLVLAGNISKVEALAGVNVKAELYFTDGIEYGQKASGKLVETNFDISAGSFSMKAGAAYIGRNLYVSITQINGTQLSGLNVYVSADDIYRAVENIIALVSDEKVINFFGGLMGNGGSGASGASTLSEEEKQSVTDLLVTLITLDYKQYITIIPDGGRTTITADIGGILDAFGVDQSAAGKATITADGDGGLDIDVYSKPSEGEAQPEYGWLRLDAVKTEKRAYDSAAYSSYINIGFVADLIDDAHKIISANTDPSTGEVSSLFTLEGGTITVNIDLSKVGVSSTLASLNQISITDINFVVGLDSNREIYFSLEGYLNDVNAKIVGITSNIASGHKIGITYTNGYITLARFDGTSREYWVMTLEYFIDNLFSSYEGNADSPLRWLCDIDKTILGINVWNDILVANLADIASGISSGITEPDNIYLYELFKNDSAFDSGNSASAMPSIIADYIIGFVSNVGTTCELGYYDSALTNLGLDSATMKYYAASLNAGQLTGGTLDALDVALIHSDDYGIGGLKAYASLQSRLVQISFNISYNGLDDNTADVENNYESALSIAGTNEDGTSKIDFYHSEPVYAGSGDNEIHYADDVFGGAKVSNNGDVVNTYQTKYIDEAITITVYQSKDDMLAGVNGKKIGVKYNSSIYMHSASNIMVSENGKINIYVMADENGEPVASNGEYPESVKVTSPNTNFYLMEVEYKAAKVTVHNILDGSAVTLNVYSGTSLDEIAKATFGDYSVRGGKWYTDADKLVAFEGTSITVPEEHEGTLYTVDLYAEFIQTNVTINGVIYTFVDGEEPHYEITGHTSSLSVYYAENSVLVLENEIDGYPVTRINANALKNDDSSLERGLQNVIVPENITYVGSNAFTDNYGIKSVIFFADSVTLEGSVSEKTYPFYGCSTVTDGTSSDLKVYFNTINGSTTVGEDWNHFRTSGSTIFDKKYYYFAAYGAGTWAFINYNITLDGETYNDQFGELTADLPSAGMLLTSVNDSFDTAEEIEDCVLNIIDEYTLEHNLCIGMYNVSVDRGVELNGYYTVNITVASTDEEWYPIQIVNVRTEGYGNGTISFGEGQYKQFKGRTYLKAGSSVTVTVVPDGESEFVSAEFGKNVYFDNPFTFVMPEEFSEITIVWQQKAEKFITVYSEVSFTYNGNSFGGSENNEYLLYESVVGEGQNTLGASVAVDAGYYFLGWAVSNGDALEFVTATVDYEKEGISYYAIWAYNGSQTLTVNNVTNSSSLLPADIAAAQGSFYAWYTSRTENPETEVVAFEGQTETLVGLNTIYYARLQFTLDFTLDGNGDTRFYVNGSQDYYTRQDCSTKDSVLLEAMGGELVVYEGGSVKVTPSNSSTQLNIYLYESIEEAEPYRVVSVTGKGKGTWGQWNKNRTFFNNSDKAASFNGFTEKTSHKYIADNAVWIQAINISGNIDFTLEY